MATMTQAKNLATLTVAADTFGVSVKTIRRYITAGRITGYKFGPRLIRVDLDELAGILSVIPTVGTIAA